MGPGQAGGRQPSDEFSCSWEMSLGSASDGLRMRHSSLSLYDSDHPLIATGVQCPAAAQGDLGPQDGDSRADVQCCSAVLPRTVGLPHSGCSEQRHGQDHPPIFPHQGGDLPSQGTQQDWTLVGELPPPPPNLGTKCSWPVLPQFPVLRTQSPSPAGTHLLTRHWPGAGSVQAALC